MKITSFDTFKELASRGTFVPVCKEIVADLLTPVSAFLKIAEDADYAFLLESVEGGEHVGRYSFLGKDPLVVVRGRDGRTTIEQAGARTERQEPFIDVVRGLMAEFHAPFVPDLPRFTGGAVGYLDYDTAEWFEPAVRLEKPPTDRDQAGFMVFDTVLAFDHVQHRILLIANARITPEDLQAMMDARNRLGADLLAVFRDHDVLVSPTAPTTAFRIGEKVDDPMAMYLNDIATIPVNLAGIAAMSLPCPPAFMRTAPPTEPGTPTAHSKPVTPADAVRRACARPRGHDPTRSGAGVRRCGRPAR